MTPITCRVGTSALYMASCASMGTSREMPAILSPSRPYWRGLRTSRKTTGIPRTSALATWAAWGPMARMSLGGPPDAVDNALRVTGAAAQIVGGDLLRTGGHKAGQGLINRGNIMAFQHHNGSAAWAAQAHQADAQFGSCVPESALKNVATAEIEAVCTHKSLSTSHTL